MPTKYRNPRSAVRKKTPRKSAGGSTKVRAGSARRVAAKPLTPRAYNALQKRIASFLVGRGGTGIASDIRKLLKVAQDALAANANLAQEIVQLRWALAMAAPPEEIERWEEWPHVLCSVTEGHTQIQADNPHCFKCGMAWPCRQEVLRISTALVSGAPIALQIREVGGHGGNREEHDHGEEQGD